jgi:hypothetical protein
VDLPGARLSGLGLVEENLFIEHVVLSKECLMTRPWRKMGKRELPTLERASHALCECPPPWEPIDPAQEAFYRRLVAAQGPALLEVALARPETRAWLLVRYLPDVPDELVRWSLDSFARETAGFSDLVGAHPDFSAANDWANSWYAERRNGATPRRAAS